MKNLQNIITERLKEDERNVKADNNKRSTLSEQKWTSDIWKELLQEGEGDLIEQAESVNLIHIPEATVESDSKPPEGYKFKDFGPSKGGAIFNELLSTATTAYKMTASRGKISPV